MLMALLYCDDDRIAAAAPACDQMPHGDGYWTDIRAGEILKGEMFETAYVEIEDANFRQQLMEIGVDGSADGCVLAKELITRLIPEYVPSFRKAA